MLYELLVESVPKDYGLWFGDPIMNAYNFWAGIVCALVFLFIHAIQWRDVCLEMMLTGYFVYTLTFVVFLAIGLIAGGLLLPYVIVLQAWYILRSKSAPKPPYPRPTCTPCQPVGTCGTCKVQDSVSSATGTTTEEHGQAAFNEFLAAQYKKNQAEMAGGTRHRVNVSQHPINKILENAAENDVPIDSATDLKKTGNNTSTISAPFGIRLH